MSGPPALASSHQLGPAFDLLANYHHGGFFLERSGLGVSAAGEALRVASRARSRTDPAPRDVGDRGPRTRRATCGGPVTRRGGVDPVRRRDAGRSVVPARTALRLDAGETWQVEVSPQGFDAAHLERERWSGRADRASRSRRCSCDRSPSRTSTSRRSRRRSSDRARRPAQGRVRAHDAAGRGTRARPPAARLAAARRRSRLLCVRAPQADRLAGASSSGRRRNCWSAGVAPGSRATRSRGRRRARAIPSEDRASADAPVRLGEGPRGARDRRRGRGARPGRLLRRRRGTRTNRSFMAPPTSGTW